MILKVPYIIVLLALIVSCTEKVAPPEPYGPVPSNSQLKWHEMEYYSLICYGLNTYTEQEWGYGDVDPSIFNPSNLDTDQWARVAKQAGMKGLILVVKHHDGFCLWPSDYTDYSVESTPWKDGKGDVLGDLSKSCEKYSLKLGVYLSPWDRHHAEYGRPGYVRYYYNQLEELMTEYGDIFEFWIDGANGGTGYYGGANERRNINRKTYYGYDTIFSIVDKYQPQTVIFSDVGPGCRWVGNEAGIAGKTNWNTISPKGKFPGLPDPEYREKLGTGDPKGEEWIPAEANTTLLWPKAWYYHSGRQPRSLKNLMDLYYTSIGRGATLNLGLAIAPSGRIREEDKQALLKFREKLNREFDLNLLENASISADNFRGDHSDFAPGKCTDGSTDTYWATDDSVQRAGLHIDFGEPTTFNRIMLQEYIKLGQRVYNFSFEIKKDGEYQEVARGTTVGYKRALRFDEVKASEARLTLQTKAPCLTLSNLGIYHAPRLIPTPNPHFDIKGNLSFDTTKEITVYYALGDQPGESEFQRYKEPLQLPYGAKVHSYVRDEESGEKTQVVVDVFGIAREQWEVVSVDGTKAKEASQSIDNNPESFFTIGSDASEHPHALVIDMRENLPVGGFSYLPRQDGKKEGIVYEYAFYVSSDGKNWGKPIATGTFDNIENNPVRQRIEFDKAVEGRYIKLVSESDVRQSGMAAFAEIEVFSTK